MSTTVLHSNTRCSKEDRMTTSGRRSVDFRDEPEIINDTDLPSDDDYSQIDDNTAAELKQRADQNGNFHETVINIDKVYRLRDGIKPTENVYHKFPKNVTHVTAEVHSEDSTSTSNEVDTLLEQEHTQDRDLLNKSNEKNITSSSDDTNIKVDTNEGVNLVNKNISIKQNDYVDMSTATNMKDIGESTDDLSKSSSSSSLGSSEDSLKEQTQIPPKIVLTPSSPESNIRNIHISNWDKKEEMQNDTCSTLSYTSFPGGGNFALVKANDWLKQSCKYDKDGFVLQSNFGHFDVTSKPVTRPWLSQFRRTFQHVYVTPNGKVIENISVQDHDGQSFITSYHTNKELTSLKSSRIKSEKDNVEELDDEIKQQHKTFNHISCMFYNMIFLGALLVVAITLLVVYTT